MQHLFSSQMEKLLHSADLNNCKAEVKRIQHELVGVGSEVIVQESSSNEIIHQQNATIFMSLATRPGLLTTLPRGVLVDTGKAFFLKNKIKTTTKKHGCVNPHCGIWTLFMLNQAAFNKSILSIFFKFLAPERLLKKIRNLVFNLRSVLYLFMLLSSGKKTSHGGCLRVHVVSPDTRHPKVQ